MGLTNKIEEIVYNSSDFYGNKCIVYNNGKVFINDKEYNVKLRDKVNVSSIQAYLEYNPVIAITYYNCNIIE